MLYTRLIQVTILIAFITIILGAYTRLSNAGLGCPDWPGCYGYLSVPTSPAELQTAKNAFPNNPVHKEKAWKEMLHRYVAGSLGVLIGIIALWSWLRRKRHQQPIILPAILLLIVLFQAALGMWTVTLLLKPLVVLMHLLFGFATLALLVILNLHARTKPVPTKPQKPYKILAAGALVILFLQIALGGWTSSNYAALVCTQLPTCQGEWLAEMDFKQAFSLSQPSGVNYAGGVLSNSARTAIHMSHRLGAVISLFYLLMMAFYLHKDPYFADLNTLAKMIVIMVCVQFGLGLANVFFSLPLTVATAHNAVAAILFSTLVVLNYRLYYRRPG